MRPGELVVATTAAGTSHLSHAYKGGAIFSLCGLHDGLTPIDPSDHVNCRRCRIEGAAALREAMHDLANLQADLERTDELIEYLRAVLGNA